MKSIPSAQCPAVALLLLITGFTVTACSRGMFETFEDVFLRKDVEGKLVKQVLNPFHWFGRKGRTQRAIEYYQKEIFHDATYADMMKPGRPLIIINASDLAYGVRFSFIQEYFDLLCSDLLTYPVANAVTASSAVPVVFNPVVVENYSDCSGIDITWLGKMRERAETMRDIELTSLAVDLESYSDKNQRKYIHFVDGGITDNMGLRATYDIVTASGGPEVFLNKNNRQQPDRMIVISIDASTEPVQDMDVSNKEPSIIHSIDAVTGVQLHRYNIATLELVESAFIDWAERLSTPEKPVHPYFIELSFEELGQPEARAYFNKVPTSFNLSNEQVDKLIAAGRQLLREHPDFQRLLTDLKAAFLGGCNNKRVPERQLITLFKINCFQHGCSIINDGIPSQVIRNKRPGLLGRYRPLSFPPDIHVKLL